MPIELLKLLFWQQCIQLTPREVLLSQLCQGRKNAAELRWLHDAEHVS